MNAYVKNSSAANASMVRNRRNPL